MSETNELVNSRRILISALSCNTSLGSEALVGYKITEALATRYELTVFASPPFEAPPGVEVISCNAGRCSFNEVSAPALMRFELEQLRKSRKLRQELQFAIVHRVTPSAIKNPSFLGLLGLPFVIGPVIAASPPPRSFEPLLRRPVSPPQMTKIHPSRLLAGISRRVITRVAASNWHLRSARMILVGNREALNRIPIELRHRCESITYAGVEHERFLPSERRSDDGLIRLLYVGRVVPYKGLELLLRAIASADRKCRMELLIIGGGDPVYSKFLKQLAGDLGINRFVQFSPPVARADLVLLYQRADVFCFPSLCDTYGIAVLEAMSCGCVPLVSDAAGPREIVPAESGIRVALSNPEQFAAQYGQKIVELAQNKALRQRLGRAAREHVLVHHDWPTIGRRLLEIYDSLQQDGKL
jgi:glycosyltransferase involved in cell wall biosynthesis